MRLLASKQTNPSLIRWEDEASGTFRLVQPKMIAKMWGSVFSGKPNLSYNNFARDLRCVGLSLLLFIEGLRATRVLNSRSNIVFLSRHYYKSGEILPVREKQLVYRCGPEALAYLKGLQTT